MSVKVNQSSAGSPPKQETPTALVQKNQLETIATVDTRNRIITVGRFNALHYYRLTKVMGQAASNSASLDMAILVCSVRQIDDEDVPMPATEKEIEALIQRLDFDGIAAVSEGLAKLNGAETKEETVENAKN